jgi:hypothetical protein
LEKQDVTQERHHSTVAIAMCMPQTQCNEQPRAAKEYNSSPSEQNLTRNMTLRNVPSPFRSALYSGQMELHHVVKEG